MSTAQHQRFRQLHQGPALLRLPNAWDAASARLFQERGAAAIATSSAAVAWSLGYADGSQLPTAELVAAVRRIARVVAVPLTVDSEDGYSDDPRAVAALVAELADAGAVGINLEDAAGTPELLCAKIAAIRAEPRAAATFINARTDVLLRQLAPKGEALPEILSRLRRYAEAGADGVFVPGLTQLEEVRAVSAAIALPLNLMLLPALLSAQALAEAGARRLSAATWTFKAAYGHACERVEAFLGGDDPAVLTTTTLDSGALNRMFARA